MLPEIIGVLEESLIKNTHSQYMVLVCTLTLLFAIQNVVALYHLWGNLTPIGIKGQLTNVLYSRRYVTSYNHL